MLLFANKMGFQWYFRFTVKMANNRDSSSKYITLKEIMLNFTEIN